MWRISQRVNLLKIEKHLESHMKSNQSIEKLVKNLTALRTENSNVRKGRSISHIRKKSKTKYHFLIYHIEKKKFRPC